MLSRQLLRIPVRGVVRYSSNLSNAELYRQTHTIGSKVSILSMLLTNSRARADYAQCRENCSHILYNTSRALKLFIDKQNPLLKRFGFDHEEFLTGAQEAAFQVSKALMSKDTFDAFTGDSEAKSVGPETSNYQYLQSVCAPHFMDVLKSTFFKLKDSNRRVALEEVYVGKTAIVGVDSNLINNDYDMFQSLMQKIHGEAYGANLANRLVYPASFSIPLNYKWDNVEYPPFYFGMSYRDDSIVLLVDVAVDTVYKYRVGDDVNDDDDDDEMSQPHVVEEKAMKSPASVEGTSVNSSEPDVAPSEGVKATAAAAEAEVVAEVVAEEAKADKNVRWKRRKAVFSFIGCVSGESVLDWKLCSME